jgi:WD40 repeat protein
MKKIYPFKFLDSYQREDKDFFFGRNDEIESLYQMIFQTRILLVYGTSGTGKTSLIQCGLANKFQTYDWLALYIRRGGNLIASLDKRLCEESDELFVYAEEKDQVIKNLRAKIDAVYKASFKPVYLIFDQFEELYVLGNKTEQQNFVNIIKEILEVEQPVKIILSIREEYLGCLYNFEQAVPELLRKKLRVEPMNLDKVKTVIKKIGESPKGNVSLQVGEEDEIAKRIFDKIRGEENTLSIQLPYLQVFLDKLYLQITKDETREAEAIFTSVALNKIGNIGDVLRDFIDEQVLIIAKKLEQKPETIWKILSPFVTLEGTKEPLSGQQICERFPNEPAELLTSVLQAFVTSRILRYTENEQLYEIAHDSLAKQVNAKRSDEEIAILEVQRLIKSQVAVKIEAREFFTEKQLLFIEPYLKKFKLSEEELDWISKSRDHLQKQKESDKKKHDEELTKTRKRLFVVSGLMVVASLALSFAVYFGFNANKQTKIAKANYLISEAKSIVSYDPTLALRLAEQAIVMVSNQKNKATALEIYAENNFYKIVGRLDSLISPTAISPDGKTVLTGSADGIVRLWGVNGKDILEFKGHTAEITSVAFSSDGKTILSGSADNTARIWDLNGNTIQKLTGHTKGVTSVAFSNDGETILTGSADSTARLWGINGNYKREFTGNENIVTCVAFSPDGKKVFTGSDFNGLLWDLENGGNVKFIGHKIASVAFSPDGNTILTAGSDNNIAILWNLDASIEQRFFGHTAKVYSIAFSPDGKKIVTGSFDNSAILWELDGEIIQEFKGHTNRITSVAFSPDRKSILTVSMDQSVRLWELKGTVINEFQNFTGEITSVAISPDGEKILTGSADSIAILWELKGNMIKKFTGHTSGVTSVSFSPDGEKILTGSNDNTARLWDLKTDSFREFKGHNAGVTSVSFSKDGEKILTGSADSTARLWDLKSNNHRLFEGHKGEVTSLAFSPDGEKILTGSEDSTARIWYLKSNDIVDLKGHKGIVLSVAFSSDGLKILTGSTDSTARLWDLKAEIIQEFKGPVRAVTSVAFSPDAKMILAGSWDKTACLWDLNGSIIQEFKGHNNGVTSVGISIDGKTILTGSADKTACLWVCPMPINEFLASDKIETLSDKQKEEYGIN